MAVLVGLGLAGCDGATPLRFSVPAEPETRSIGEHVATVPGRETGIDFEVGA
jgi:hypothetical protein